MQPQPQRQSETQSINSSSAAVSRPPPLPATSSFTASTAQARHSSFAVSNPDDHADSSLISPSMSLPQKRKAVVSDANAAQYDAAAAANDAQWPSAVDRASTVVAPTVSSHTPCQPPSTSYFGGFAKMLLSSPPAPKIPRLSYAKESTPSSAEVVPTLNAPVSVPQTNVSSGDGLNQAANIMSTISLDSLLKANWPASPPAEAAPRIQ